MDMLQFRRAALVVAASAMPLVAATAEDAVVVTATRQAMRANELLSDVSVVMRDEIERAGQATLAEFLGMLPGIEFVANGSPGAASNLLIRGANSGHVQLLIDGQRMGSATLGEPTWSRLPLSQIERIEILRGPASALYGSEAIGGVVQVFTRRGEGPPAVSAEAGVGSYGSAAAAGGVAGATGGWRYSVNVNGATTKGFNSIRNAGNSAYNPDRDGFRSQGLTAGVSFAPAKGHELGAHLFHGDGRNDYDGGSGATAVKRYENQATVQSLGLWMRNALGPGWTSTLRAGRSTDDSTSYTNGSMSSIFRTDQDQLAWQNDVRLPAGDVLIALERLSQRVGGTGGFTVSRRTIGSALAGWTARLGGHRLQLSARQDANSQFGTRRTGALGWGYLFDPFWRLRAGFGTAFRAPSFNDLYYPLTFGSRGNPNLRPEQSTNRELALHHEGGGRRFSLTWYRNRVRDLISWVETPPGSFAYVPFNVASATLEGLTLDWQGEAFGFETGASLDLQDPRDDSSGRQLVRRARQRLKAALGRQHGPWQWRAEMVAVSSRYDDAANTKRLGGYGLLNLYAGYRFDRGWSAFVRVNNAFGKRYDLARDYATPQADVFLGVRYSSK